MSNAVVLNDALLKTLVPTCVTDAWTKFAQLRSWEREVKACKIEERCSITIWIQSGGAGLTHLVDLWRGRTNYECSKQSKKRQAILISI
jgi:hypothetical protein